jgi:hypothetical protein
VRVLDTNLRPGERTPVHAHEWPAALYVLSWSDFVRYDVAGNVLLDSKTLPTRPQVGRPVVSRSVGPLERYCGSVLMVVGNSAVRNSNRQELP